MTTERSFFLPTDGSIVVADDKFNEALPIIEALSKYGLAATYYNGSDKYLPASPIQKVRLFFCDIEFSPIQTSKNYAANIAQILDKVIPDQNGPYVIVLWSSLNIDNEAIWEQTLTYLDPKKHPIAKLFLNKRYFGKSDFNRITPDMDAISASLRSSHTTEELSNLLKLIEDASPGEDLFTFKDDFIPSFCEKLRQELKEHADIFEFFLIWENIITKSAGGAVNRYASIVPTGTHWANNFKHVIHRMADAQSSTKASPKVLVLDALKTINQTFLDDLEKVANAQDININIDTKKWSIQVKLTQSEDIYTLEYDVANEQFKLLVNDTPVPGLSPTPNVSSLPNSVRNQGTQVKDAVSNLERLYLSIAPNINSQLHTMDAIEPHQPGNIYEVAVTNERKPELIKAYFGKKAILDDTLLNQIKFIELEVSPPCDYANNKWLRHRMLPGIMFPSDESYGKLVDNDSLYKDMPQFIFEEGIYRLVFDFRLFKSYCQKENNLQPPILKLRSEALSDITSKLSNHVNRLGISAVINR